MKFFKGVIVWVLTLESRLILRKYKPFIVAVTGSVGKTSTKDAIYDVLTSPKVCADQHLCYVRKSEKSLNSEIGLPLTVIGVPNAWHSLSGWMRNIGRGLALIVSRTEYPDCLVLEIGADHPGDIKRVTRWLKPDIAVITKISRTPVHVEFFSSPEEVFEEKAYLAKAVKKDGTLALFADDDKVSALSLPAIESGIKVITFGTNEKAEIRGSGYAVTYKESKPTGISFDLTVDGTTAKVNVNGLMGSAFIYSFLAAAAVGKARGLALNDIVNGLNHYEAPRGRMNIIEGINSSTIIDDTYNSSPDAVATALETMKGLRCSGRKIAILGDMMELGKYSAEEHKKVGRVVAEVLKPNGFLITVGPRSRATAEEALKQGMQANMVISFDSSEEALPHVSTMVQVGCIVMVKGSQSVRMERIVKALMREPEKAAELLVRQEKEWLEKK